MYHTTKKFTLNDNKKIEFTEDELKSLLEEAYNNGYTDAKIESISITYGRNYYPYCTTTYTTSSKDNEPLWYVNSTSTKDDINKNTTATLNSVCYNKEEN